MAWFNLHRIDVARFVLSREPEEITSNRSTDNIGDLAIVKPKAEFIQITRRGHLAKRCSHRRGELSEVQALGSARTGF
jgi:hypothetical protein